MKTTIEFPDELFRQSKATAALRGESLKELVAQALREHLENPREARPRTTGWRTVFGRASKEEVQEIDSILAEDLGQIDPAVVTRDRHFDQVPGLSRRGW
jgi:hypothetical protein